MKESTLLESSFQDTKVNKLKTENGDDRCADVSETKGHGVTGTEEVALNFVTLGSI